MTGLLVFILGGAIANLIVFYLALRLIAGNERKEGCLPFLIYFILTGVIMTALEKFVSEHLGVAGALAIQIGVSAIMINFVFAVRFWKALLIEAITVAVSMAIMFSWLMFGPVSAIKLLVEEAERTSDGQDLASPILRIPAEKRLNWKP